MKASEAAELSAVVVSMGGADHVRPSLEALAAQTALERMELVLVSPAEINPADALLAPFGRVRVVRRELDTLGRSIAAGFLAAGAPVVAYAEEHSLPEPGWAEALIERHRGPWVAVGWSLANANPATTASWAHLLTDFGPGVRPVRSGERSGAMPWHHISYKREALTPYGESLGEAYEAEGLLQEDLVRRGGRLFMEGGVCSRHINISRLRWNLRSHFYGGRGYGAARADHASWSRPRRLAYAAAFPLVPLVRLKRLRLDMARTREERGRKPGLVASLAVNLLANALGEAVGYVKGAGPARHDRLPMELERRRFLGPRDDFPVALRADPFA